MGERSVRIREVEGSNPFVATTVVADVVSFATTFFQNLYLALTPSLLLTKPDPLRRAPVLFCPGWEQKR